DDRGYVVRKPAIVLASLPECVTNHHVREERQGRMRAARVSNQRGRQARVVENRVDSLVGETLLEHTELLARVASENAGRELRVVPRELMTSVGENHLPSLSPSHTREYRRVRQETGAPTTTRLAVLPRQCQACPDVSSAARQRAEES